MWVSSAPIHVAHSYHVLVQWPQSCVSSVVHGIKDATRLVSLPLEWFPTRSGRTVLVLACSTLLMVFIDCSMRSVALLPSFGVRRKGGMHTAAVRWLGVAGFFPHGRFCHFTATEWGLSVAMLDQLARLLIGAVVGPCAAPQIVDR